LLLTRWANLGWFGLGLAGRPDWGKRASSF
jgi:hypothetical protein